MNDAAEPPLFFGPRFFLSAEYLRRDDAVFDELHRAGTSVDSALGEFVTGWSRCRRTLRSPEATASPAVRDVLWQGRQVNYPLASELSGQWLVFVSGDDHRRLRSLAIEVVEGGMRADLCETFSASLEALLDRCPPTVDVIGDLVKPTVVAVIARHFGDGQTTEPHVAALGALGAWVSNRGGGAPPIRDRRGDRKYWWGDV